MTDLDHDEVPALFWWFPNQDDFKPPPPSDETLEEKLERISSTVKVRQKSVEIMNNNFWDYAQEKLDANLHTDILKINSILSQQPIL